MFVLNSDHIGNINGKKYNWPRSVNIGILGKSQEKNAHLEDKYNREIFLRTYQSKSIIYENNSTPSSS